MSVQSLVESIKATHVKQHTRTTATGKVVNVSEHDDKRRAAFEASMRAHEASHKLRDGGDKKAHLDAAEKHTQAAKLHRASEGGNYVENLAESHEAQAEEHKKKAVEADKPKLRSFTESDWDGMAGATRFKDGSQPFIGEKEMPDGSFHTVVGDADGVQVMVMGPGFEDRGFLNLDLSNDDMEKSEIKFIAQRALNANSIEKLRKLGFDDSMYRVDAKSKAQDTLDIIHCRMSAGNELPATKAWKQGEPVEFMYMPAGLHTITAGFRGKAINLTVQVEPNETAETLTACLSRLTSEAPKQRPFGCVEHEEKDASVWARGFSAKQDGVYLAAEPSALGERNVNGRIHRSWSPSFTTDADYARATLSDGVYRFPDGVRGSASNPARITGVAFCVGTLTNKPAFREIAPVLAKDMNDQVQATHVKEHTRTTATGKVVNVKSYDDARSEAHDASMEAHQHSAFSHSGLGGKIIEESEAKGHKKAHENHAKAAEAHEAAAMAAPTRAAIEIHRMQARHHKELSAHHEEQAKHSGTRAVASAHGYHETGSGDDFVGYGHKDDVKNQVYIKDDGSWEHHDLAMQENDEPGSARAAGRSPKSLHEYLSKKKAPAHPHMERAKQLAKQGVQTYEAGKGHENAAEFLRDAANYAHKASSEAESADTYSKHHAAAIAHDEVSQAYRKIGNDLSADHHAKLSNMHGEKAETIGASNKGKLTPDAVLAAHKPILTPASALARATLVVSATHVKQHTRTDIFGNVITVKSYNDSRNAAKEKTATAYKESAKVSREDPESHNRARQAHTEAAHASYYAASRALNKEDEDEHMEQARAHDAMAKSHENRHKATSPKVAKAEAPVASGPASAIGKKLAQAMAGDSGGDVKPSHVSVLSEAARKDGVTNLTDSELENLFGDEDSASFKKLAKKYPNIHKALNSFY